MHPEEQGLPVGSVGGGGGGDGATSCLAAMHSVILGMMGPLKSDRRRLTSDTDEVIPPDTVVTVRQLAVAVFEEDALSVLSSALLEVCEGGAAGRGVAELLALVRTSTSILQSDFLRYFQGTSKTNAML